MSVDVKSLEFRITKSWKEYASKNPWASFIPEFAENEEGQKFMKPVGRSVVYRVVKEEENQQEYICNTCGSEILSINVAHPVWDKPFLDLGSKQCKYEIVPYCPRCENQPNSSGRPVEQH